MKRRDLERMIKEIELEKPDEEALLRSEERLIRKVKISFPNIIKERRLMMMRRRKIAFGLVSLIIVVALLLTIAIPRIRVARAKDIAKEVIKANFNIEVSDSDMVVKGDSVSVVVNGNEVLVDTKNKKVFKIIPPEEIPLTEEEKNRAVEIFKNSPKVKNFPLPPILETPPEEGETSNDGGIVVRKIDKPNEPMRYVDLSNAKIISIKGYKFSKREGKYAKIEVESELLPKGKSATFLIDLDKGEVVGAGSGPVIPVEIGIIEKQP